MFDIPGFLEEIHRGCIMVFDEAGKDFEAQVIEDIFRFFEEESSDPHVLEIGENG